MEGMGPPTNRGLFRSRKKVFTFCLIMLAVTFAVIIMGGQHQQGSLYKWLDVAGDRHKSEDSNTDDAAPAKNRDAVAKVRSNKLFDEFLDSVPDSEMEGDLNVDNAQAVPVEGALSVDVSPTEGAISDNAAPVEGAISVDASPTEGAISVNAAPAEGGAFIETKYLGSASKPESKLSPLQDTNDFIPIPDNRGNENTDLVSNFVLSKEGADNTNSEHNTLKKGADTAETEQSPTKEDPSEDPHIAAAPVNSKDRTISQTTENVIPPHKVTQTAYYDICETCCYRYTTIDEDITKVLNETLLRERGCQKRLPDAMIFGVKKGGTTTLKNFLSYHPDIAFTHKEMKFFTSKTEAQKGLEYYRSRMIPSTPRQISMEKTPAYSHYPKVPSRIKKALPNVKLIIIVRDPVQRAVSDYVHMLVTIAKRCRNSSTTTTGGFSSTQSNDILPPDCMYKTSYRIAQTFENSVINKQGEVKTTSQLISKGMYVTDIKRYLEYFRPDQILALDGEAFIRNPYPAIKEVERFLGIRDYFTPDFFYFEEKKGFFCLNKPIPNNCMSLAKGRPHPVVQEEVLQKLRDFYKPYNDDLRQLVNLGLESWSS